MAGMPYEMSELLSHVVLPLYLMLLLLVVCYRITAAIGELQESRQKKHQRRGKKRHTRAFVLQKSSRLSRKCCSVQLEMQSTYKTVRQFTRTTEDITTYLDTLEWGMSKRSNSSWTTITDTEDESRSKVSLPPLSDNSRNSIMARNVEVDRCLEAGSKHQHKQDLQIQLGAPSPTPEQRDMEGRKTESPMAHHKSQNTVEAFSPEKKLGQEQGLPPKVGQTLQDATASASPSWQPQKARDMMLWVFPVTRDPPLLDMAVKRQLEQHIGKMKIPRRYGLPTKVLEYERNFEDMALIQEAAQPPAMQRHSVLPYCSPIDCQDGHHQGEKAAKQHPGPQKESADPVDTCPQQIPAPSAQPQKARDILVLPMVRDPPLLDGAVKRQLEWHIAKMKIQRRYGLPTKVLEYERNFEDMALIQEAAQPPAMQRHSVLPYCSPIDCRDGHHQDEKAAKQHPGPQKESADPVDMCPQQIPAPSAQPQKARDVLVLPMVRDPPLLDGTVKRQLEQHIAKMKIQRRYGLPTKVLEYERNFEDMALIQEAAQPPAMQRHSVLPYCSPFDRQDGRHQGEKAAKQHPSPQKESADPVDTCPQQIPAPSAQPQKARDVLVLPMVRNPPLLNWAVKRQLEQHIGKMKIQRRLGLPTKVLEYERNFEDMALIQEAAQPPAKQRRSVLPYRSPVDRRDGCHQGKKAAKQHPGPQKESADPVDTCPQQIPAPSAQPQKARDILVLPMVRDPPLLDGAVKRQLEWHIAKMKIQRRYGLPTKVLEYERNFEDMALIQEAAQPPAMQRHSVLPYCSPIDCRDGHHQDEKAAKQHPGPQKESADPVDMCPQQIPAPSAQPQKARDVLVLPMVRDPPLLDGAVKRQLEWHIAKMKIQRRYGLPTKVLEYERNFEDMALIQEAAQPPAMQRHSVLPYRSPFDRQDGRHQGEKAAKQHPSPQKESADPVDTCPQQIPAPSAQPQKARDVLVLPMVRNPPLLNWAVKRQLEQHIGKMKIQRRLGLPTKVLEYERNFEGMALIQEAAQPPAKQRRSVLPYRSPVDRRDGCHQGKKAAKQHPGPQKESADPVDMCPQGNQVPTQSGTAAFLGRPKEMAQQDGETPPWTNKFRELAGGGKAGKKTLPGTAGKEQGPGTQGDGHGPSLSGQAKWALPQSKGGPQGQSGQGSESPSISRGHMGPPELPLEKRVPVQQADHSMEGQSSSSEDVGTPELLLSKGAAPLSKSSPQAQSPSLEKRPSALPLPPDSAGPNLIPFLSVLTDYLRTRQAAVGLRNQLRLLWQQLYPDEAELHLESHSPRGAEKGKRSAEDSARSRRLCPQCSKASHLHKVMVKRSLCEFEWPQLQSAPTSYLPHRTVQVARI